MRKKLEQKGKIIVVIAPSGTGKSTLLQKLMQEIPQLEWSISSTTRQMREGEVDGVNYHFIGVEEFHKLEGDGEFIEWAKVHSNLYGTQKKFVNEGLTSGKNLLFDLDVQGGDAMKDIYEDCAKVIFIEPPSVEELERRLLARATDKYEIIQERLKNAKKELTRKDDYDYKVVNDDFDKAYNKLKQIVLEILKE